MQERNRRTETEQLVRWAAGGILLALGAVLVWLTLEYLAGVLVPVLLGYGLAAWIRSMGRFVRHFTGNRRLGLGRAGERIGGGVLAIALCILIGMGGYRGISVLAAQAGSLVEQAADLLRWESLPPWLAERIPLSLRDRIGAAVGSLLEKGAGWLAGWAGSTAAALPGALLTVFVTGASVFYWLLDREGILASARALLPADVQNHPWLPRLRKSAARGLETAGRYLRAQLAIGAVIFTVLLAGLSLLRVPSPAAWAFLTTLVDLLPLFGAGAVLLPWAVWAWLTEGGGMLAFGLPVLWLVTWLLRQWMEPRVLGKMLGAHPYILLWAMYAGFRLAGMTGMLAAVLALVVLGRA